MQAHQSSSRQLVKFKQTSNDNKIAREKRAGHAESGTTRGDKRHVTAWCREGRGIEVTTVLKFLRPSAVAARQFGISREASTYLSLSSTVIGRGLGRWGFSLTTPMIWGKRTPFYRWNRPAWIGLILLNYCYAFDWNISTLYIIFFHYFIVLKVAGINSCFSLMRRKIDLMNILFILNLLWCRSKLYWMYFKNWLKFLLQRKICIFSDEW